MVGVVVRDVMSSCGISRGNSQNGSFLVVSRENAVVLLHICLAQEKRIRILSASNSFGIDADFDPTPEALVVPPCFHCDASCRSCFSEPSQRAQWKESSNNADKTIPTTPCWGRYLASPTLEQMLQSNSPKCQRYLNLFYMKIMTLWVSRTF